MLKAHEENLVLIFSPFFCVPFAFSLSPAFFHIDTRTCRGDVENYNAKAKANNAFFDMLFSHCSLVRVRWHEKLLHCKSGNLFIKSLSAFFQKSEIFRKKIHTHTHTPTNNGDNLISFYRFFPPHNAPNMEI